MPCLQKPTSVLANHHDNTRKFGGTEAVAVGDRNLRLNPDFGIAAATSDVNMRWFAW